MSINFILAVEGQQVPAAPVQSIINDKSSPDFTSSSLEVFSLSPNVSRQVLRDVATELNNQASASLGFDSDEFEELGPAVIIPNTWRLSEKNPNQSVQWFVEHFPKNETTSSGQRKWYPVGFLGIAEANWKDTGIVLVHYDANGDELTTATMLLDPSKAGETLISLRQGDDDFHNNIRRWHEKSRV